MRTSRLVALLILLVPATATAEPIGVAWLDHTPQDLSPEFFTRPVETATLVVGPLSAKWPSAVRPTPVPESKQLLLVKFHDDSPALQSLSLLPARPPYALLALKPEDWMRLPHDLHGEPVRYRPRVVQRESRGLSASSKAADPALKSDIVDAVDADALEQIVRELAGDLSFQLDSSTETIPERHSCRPGVDLAADYLQDRLESMGYSVGRQDFPIPSGSSCPGGATGENVVATKTGSVAPDEIVVVGAHYDSISYRDNPDGPAPGAEDNGSGTAAVLHLASIFANYETERTIQFVLFSGEEQFLYGSQAFVDEALLAGDDIIAALTMDMMSAWVSNYRIDVEGWADGDPCNCWELMLLFESNVNTTSPGLATVKTFPGFGSDHVPFHAAGIPTLLAIESDYYSYPGYHRTTDTLEKLDFEFGRDVVRGMAATLADLTTPSDPVPVLVSGFEAQARGDGLQLRWSFAEQSGAGTLRLERALAGREFQPMPGAAWPLFDQPGEHFDDLWGIESGTEVDYRLTLTEAERATVVAQLKQFTPARTNASTVLRAPRPNPFGDESGSILRFRLAHGGPTTLDVFDAAGRRVRRILSAHLPAGEHQRGWDGRDDGGSAVSAGVYFVQLQTGAQLSTRRLVKLR